MVIGRGRMRKYIARRLLFDCGSVPDKWRSEEDSEASEESQLQEVDTVLETQDSAKPANDKGNGDLLTDIEII